MNPFTDVILAIWSALEQSPLIRTSVRVGNKIRRLRSGTGTKVVLPKEDILPADLPEIDVAPAGGRIERQGQVLIVEWVFEVRLAVEGMALDDRYLPLLWAMVQAIAKAGGCNLGIPYIEKFMMGDYTAEESDLAAMRGLVGWSTLLTATARMRFNVADLQLA